MNTSKRVLYSFFLLLCASILLPGAHAQFRAGIQGTVMDKTGGVLTGARVLVTSQESGKVTSTTTNDSGFYSVTGLAPGLYTVSVEQTGFKTSVTKDVEVSAESARGVDLSLAPGQVSEQVVVSGDAIGTLQTEDASLSGTITKQQVQELPQFRGDPFELLRLTPGVFGLGARDGGGNSANLPNYSGVGGSNRSIFQDENAVQISANGSRVEANGYQLDGVSTNSQAWGGASVLTPNQESVKEIKIDVSPYTAENGHNSGAVVQVVSQNGTNQLHGSAVLRIHSPGLNAFQRWGGQNNASPNRDNQLLHNYLGSLGGPILKNKLFFFFSFEHMITGGNNTSNSWVETPQYIAGLPATSLASQIFAVPGSGFSDAKQLTSTCAALLGAGSTIPCATVTGGVDIGSPTGSSGQIVGNSGGGLDGIPDVQLLQYSGKPDNISATQYNGRVDFNATKKDLIAFSIFHAPVTKSFQPGGWVTGRQYDVFSTNSHHDTATVLWTRTINSTIVNEARANVTRWYFNEQTSNPEAPWGIPTSNINIPNNTIGVGPFNAPGIFYQTTYAFRDTVSKIYRNHVLKFGFDYAREQNNDVSAGGARPTYNFDNLWSFANDAPTSQGGANFDPKTGLLTEFRKYVRVSDYALFAQDSWKLRPNLTLTLGLRYDYFTPLHDKFNSLSNIVLGQGAAALTGAVIKSGGNISEPDRNNFGPQLGFAWSPRSTFGHEWNNKMVWRGGVGIAYNRVPESILLQARSNPPSFVNISFDASELIYALSSGGIHDYGDYPANPNAILTFDPATGFPNGGEHLSKADIRGPLQNMRTPYTVHFSLETQYELARNWVASLSYQGSQARKLPRTLNYSLFFDPNPNINSIFLTQTDVNSGYNALLARITHQFSRSFEFSANYRWSKSIDFCSSDQNCQQTFPFNQSTERGPSDFDVTHSFTGYALYELPFFKSRHDWLYTIAGGWKLSGIFTLNSGFPWTPVFQGSNCINVANRGNVCPVRPVAYLGGAGSDYSTSNFQGPGNFPNGGLAYFTLPPDPSTYTVPPLPGVGRNSFRGPRYTGIDMSFGKRFTLPKLWLLGENAGFELKANAFNVFNKLNLSPFGFNSGSTQVNSPNFGKATGALGGRTIEFMGRFSF